MQAKDMYGNELQVGDLIAAKSNSQQMKYVLFITQISVNRTVYGHSLHASAGFLCSFNANVCVDPADYIKLQPVPGLVQPLIVDESTEPTVRRWQP